MLTILGWLWKNPVPKSPQYTPEHANIWASMIHRNTTLPHRFVVATDWPTEQFDPIITPIPLWDEWKGLKNPKWAAQKPHCYVRLKAFSREAGEFIGPRFVSVDLDCLVLDSLDPIFSRTEDFLIFHRFIDSQRFNILHNPYNGSMWMMTAGARAQVWEDFKGLPSIMAAQSHMGSDQAWITHRLGKFEAGWGREDGVLGWPNIQADQRYEHTPPPGIRLIFFYGLEKPWDYLPTSAKHGLPYNHRDVRRRNRVYTQIQRFEWIQKYYR